MKLRDNPDPLIRLAWLATRIQKRRGARSFSANKQLLCWKAATDFLPAVRREAGKNREALILGLAATLEEELTRKFEAAAREHRENQPLSQGCIAFAEHFVDHIWDGIFQSREPASAALRRMAAIYRFALLEIYRERGIGEASDDNSEGHGRET